MDPRHFDALSRVLSTVDSRRGLLAFLATLPVLGGLLNLGPADVEGAGRRKRRKKAHKHGRGRRRKRNGKKTCRPQPVSQTCAGTCGSVTNNCRKTVNCGSCTCNPSCATCFTCQDGPNTPGTCVVDPDQVGDPCGSAGQVCQADGACACDATSCPDCTTCERDGQCAPCADCCDSTGVCQDGDTNAACGSSGTCDVCTGQEQCQHQTCTCTATCTGKACGADDGCGGICTTGSCPTDQTCQPDGACLQNLNQFQCLCGDSTTPAGCVREQCQPEYNAVCDGLCAGHGGYYGLGTPGTGCGPDACTP